jgi:hypothetical protein
VAKRTLILATNCTNYHEKQSMVSANSCHSWQKKGSPVSTCLVTGVAGFIAAKVAELLLAEASAAHA